MEGKVYTDQLLCRCLILVWKLSNCIGLVTNKTVGNVESIQRQLRYEFYLDNPVCLPEVHEFAEPVVYLVHLDADHVPEPGQVLAGGHEGVLVARDILKYLQFRD